LHILEYNVVVVRVFEEINELDDVRMLAHLENLDLSSLLVDFDGLHVLLLHSLNSHLL